MTLSADVHELTQRKQPHNSPAMHPHTWNSRSRSYIGVSDPRNGTGRMRMLSSRTYTLT